MVKIEGKLSIKQMKGTKGAFCVGELVTDIGTFKVKDQVLDQYDEGTYTGIFVLSQIYLASYTYYGRYNVEMRAKLADMVLDSADAKSARVDVPTDPDPAEEGTLTEHPVASPPAKFASLKQADFVDPSTAKDVELFGMEIAAAVVVLEPVKLDPTIDRVVFRTQRDRLRSKGYKWEPTIQQWLHPSQPSSSKEP